MVSNCIFRIASQMRRHAGGLHRDQQGSISIISVFAVILLVMLFGMVLNCGKQVDQRVKMQNAADAATYTGSVVVGRGMNTLAFTNHLLCDVFALTAFMREARDRDAEMLTEEILDNWARIGPSFEKANRPDYGGFQTFGDLGAAITDKVPHEREVVERFSDWAAAASEMMLPVFEQILAEEQIPEFQHALIRATPQLAQIAADEVAQRHGRAWPQPVELRSVLWRTDGAQLFAGDDDDRWMPVVDPAHDERPDLEIFRKDATGQRFDLSHRYLRRWNDESLPLFDGHAKMSQFGSLWRVFTGGHLQQLLEEEYPNTNLPFQILTRPGQVENLNQHLEYRYMLVGVVYRKQAADEMPGIFHNPVMADTQAYAQAMVFVPKRRLIKQLVGPDGQPIFSTPAAFTGIPGQGLTVDGPRSSGGPPPAPPAAEPPSPGEEEEEERYVVVRQSAAYHPDQWTLIAQNWTAQIVPATCLQIPRILSQKPSGPELAGFIPPDLTAMNGDEFLWLSNH